jgi:hypothetical protein
VQSYCSNWEIRKRLTDYSELTFFTSNSNNLLKNKINCVSLFQITLYEDFWWPVSSVSMCNKLTQTKFEVFFFSNFTNRFFYIISFESTVSCFKVSNPFIVYYLIFENFAVQAWTISILVGCISVNLTYHKLKLVGLLLLHANFVS